ncbi:MAG: asparagine synthase-related protein [Vicinamibacterales bacterium]
MSHVTYRGPDGIRNWYAPGIAMAFAKFARTPDALADRQPLEDPGTQTCVTFDGRLDNREELAAQLDLRVSDSTPDSVLASAAYWRWGLDCPVRLLGDFSLVVWDGRERRLFMARDIFGLRPLFYRRMGDGLWWASDQQALVSPRSPAINEGYVGELLSDRMTTIDETIYEEVRRLPMAHALTICGTGLRQWRYWRPNPDDQPRHRDPRDYEEQFRTLLKEAVRVRLRANGPAALMLSGGIDSSSVAVQISELLRGGDEAASRITAFSLTIPDHAACEGRVIRQVLERVPLASHLVSARDPTEADFESDATASLDLPELPNSIMTRPLRDAAVANGCAVALTGYGGDEWFDTSYAELSDLLRRGGVIASVGWLKRVAQVPGRIPLPQILKLASWMALPETARQVVRRRLSRNPVPRWIEPRFARDINLADRFRRQQDAVQFESLAQREMFRDATGGEQTFRTDHEERYHAACGLEQRHPLMDRRLVEFALALPPRLRCSQGKSKALVRWAMSDTLPEAVTGTSSSTDYCFLGLRVLSRLGGLARLLDGEAVRRRWLRPNETAELYRKLQDGASRSLWPLCSATGIDFWLRAVERRDRVAPGE